MADSTSPAPTALRTLCPTRWTVRHGAIDSILKNYRALMSTLEVIQQGHNEYAAKGKGLLLRMDSFDLFLGLHLAYRVFSAAEQLSVNLQSKDTTVSEGSKGTDLLQKHYTSLRSTEAFDKFYDKVLKESSGVTEEPVLPRYHKRPSRVKGGSDPHRFSSARDMYRQAYFEVLDLAVGEVNRRFDQQDLALVVELELVFACQVSQQHGRRTQR